LATIAREAREPDHARALLLLAMAAAGCDGCGGASRGGCAWRFQRPVSFVAKVESEGCGCKCWQTPSTAGRQTERMVAVMAAVEVVEVLVAVVAAAVTLTQKR
jgi:hypothetical protein